jgi:hypothetical protein
MYGWRPGSRYAAYKYVSYLASLFVFTYFGQRPTFTDRQGGQNALMITMFRDGIIYYVYLLCESSVVPCSRSNLSGFSVLDDQCHYLLHSTS